jgi:predicted amidohydrolase YtcJ
VQGLAESENASVPIHIPHSVKSTDEVLERLKARASQLPPGTWIIGQGTYNQPMPTRQELDKALPDHPVVLRWSSHDLLLNHKANEVAKLGRQTPDPKGVGRIERTPNGEVMILRDAGVELPLPRPSYEDFQHWLPVTLRDFYLRHGVTSVADMSAPNVAYKIYEELNSRGELPVRMLLSYRPRGKDLAQFDEMVQNGVRTGSGNDWIRTGAIKIQLDGVWGTTAATYRPAWKGSGTTWIPNNTGGTSYTPEELNATVLAAHKAGFQVWTHANGDRAQDMIITAYEEALKASPRPDARHRIEHFAHFLVQDPVRTTERLARMTRAGIIPAPQVAFLWRLTDENVKEPDLKFFPMATLIRAGFRPSGGSDTLGTQNFATNPWFTISVAVNRKTKYGTPANPEEAIPVLEAIKMQTIWAAYAGFEEQVKGSIEVGKLADLVVLSSDPLTTAPEALASIRPETVVLDGKVAYKAIQ